MIWRKTRKRVCVFFKGKSELSRNSCVDLIAVFCLFRLNLDASRDDEEEMGTLCQCALKVAKEVLPETKLTSILIHLLAQERADTLSK